jgi:hypothetical protein
LDLRPDAEVVGLASLGLGDVRHVLSGLAAGGAVAVITPGRLTAIDRRRLGLSMTMASGMLWSNSTAFPVMLRPQPSHQIRPFGSDARLSIWPFGRGRILDGSRCRPRVIGEDDAMLSSEGCDQLHPIAHLGFVEVG